MVLDLMYTSKQQEVLRRAKEEDWFIMLMDGAKRSGKTVINNDLFISSLIRIKKIATKQGINTPMFILAGYSKSTIQTNMLTEISNKYGYEFKFDKYNNFTMFGVYVVTTFHGSVSGLGAIRGMTSHGAYINEASLANEEVFDEIISRCSGTGARIIGDTNPDHPEHWLKKNYFDKADGKRIVTFHFEIDDNTFLDSSYIDNIKASTPSGMFYDRNIRGLWVSGDGVVYKDFDMSKHPITEEEAGAINFDRFFCGVDWGWEHYGSIVVLGYANETYYLLEEHAHQHKSIEGWVMIAKRIQGKYGGIPFYCDSARPEYVDAFVKEGIKATNANKSVLTGIEFLATLMKQMKFRVVYEEMSLFKKEIFSYIWKKNTGEPKKENDDVLDSLRYGVYSDYIINKNKRKSLNKNQLKNIRGIL